MSSNYRRDDKRIAVKVTNVESQREDVHYNLSEWEVEWIALSPGLKVEVIENRRKRGRVDEKAS